MNTIQFLIKQKNGAVSFSFTEEYGKERTDLYDHMLWLEGENPNPGLEKNQNPINVDENEASLTRKIKMQKGNGEP